VSAFPLTKVPTLASYVSILRTIGAPVDAGLRRARLPTLFEEIPDAWIPYERVRYFTADMAEREVIPNLGLIPQASSLQHALTQSFLAPVLSTPSLFQALQRIPSLTSRITTDIRFWLEPAGDQIRACLVLPAPLEVPGYDIGETRTLGLIKKIIRVYAGPDFKPTRVLLASRARDLRFDLEHAYNGVPVKTDQPYGAIEFPRALLASICTSTVESPTSSNAPTPDVELPATFAESLEACLIPYLLDGYPHIDLGAEIAGCSVRTLQRKLSKEQKTYSDIIEKIRCRAAMSLLYDVELKIAQIAILLGYSDQSAFTRAFRSWTSITPGEYRASEPGTGSISS